VEEEFIWRPSRFDFYAATFLVSLVLALTIMLWAYHVLIGAAAAALLIGFSVLRVIMSWQHHVMDIEAKRHAARIPHASDNGFAYVDEKGNISGYSHAISGGLLPPGMELTTRPGGDSDGSEHRLDYPRSFGELVRGGYVFPGADFCIGFSEETGDAIRMPALTSLGVGGGQGFGKTTTAELIMLEAVAKYNGRIRFLVIDPHINVADEDTLYQKTIPLSPFFLTYDGLSNPVGLYGEEEALTLWMYVWRTEFERRMQGGAGLTWVLVMDEGAAVFSSSIGGEVAKLLEDINRQARKVNMFAVVISQEWKVSRTGSSEMRSAIVSYILHNMPESIAELIVPSDVARQTQRLDIGEAVVYANGSDKRGRVPYVTERDAERLVEQYAPRSIVEVKEIYAIPPQRNIQTVATNLLSVEVGGSQESGALPAAETVRRTRKLDVPDTDQDERLPVGVSEEEVASVRSAFTKGLAIGTIAWETYGSPTNSTAYSKDVAQAKVRAILEFLVAR